MTVPLPTTLPAVSSWSLVDWLDRSYTSDPAAADGTALITLDALADDTRWQLTHMVAGCATTAAPQMRLYLDSVANGNLRDGTSSGAFDVADWPGGLMVPPGRQLLARWTGCTPGDVAILSVQANIYRRASS